MIGNQLQTNSVKLVHKSVVQFEDFQIQYKLGQGAYGYVYLASKDCVQYALKQMSKHKLTKFHKQYTALVQKQLLKVIDHPGIIKIKGSFQSRTKIYLMLQYCDGMGFHQFLNDSSTNLSESIKRFYISQLVNILEYLHSNGIVHRDLKPQNMMINKKGHLKLLDFGTADFSKSKLISNQFKHKIAEMKLSEPLREESISESEQSPQKHGNLQIRRRKSTFVGSAHYISPQLIEFNYCESPADIWALGCILYTLYYGFHPFEDQCELTIYQKIKSADINYEHTDSIPSDAIDLIKKLLIKQPLNRLGSCSSEQTSFKALKNHQFFKNINVDEVFNSPPPFQIPQNHFLLSKFEQINDILYKKKQGLNLCSFEDKFYELMIRSSDLEICFCQFEKDLTFKITPYQKGLKPEVYCLQYDRRNKIIQCLAESKLAISLSNSTVIVLYAQRAQQIANKINEWYSSSS